MTPGRLQITIISLEPHHCHHHDNHCQHDDQPGIQEAEFEEWCEGRLQLLAGTEPAKHSSL